MDHENRPLNKHYGEAFLKVEDFEVSMLSVDIYAILLELFSRHVNLAHQFLICRWDIVKGENSPA